MPGRNRPGPAYRYQHVPQAFDVLPELVRVAHVDGEAVSAFDRDLDRLSTHRDLDHIQALKRKHGIDYDSHGCYRFVEA